jgi:membrane-associated phospholipid phosphatase
MIHIRELEIIYGIHQFRNPFFDQFFKLFDFFDRQEFFFILIPIIWLWFGWRIGLKLFYILLLSSLFNHDLKEFFSSPRPFHLDPNIGIIQVSGLGFPSGAAQTVILLSGILLKSWKNYWGWFIACTYILLVSFSRIYLGIHFPSDILGGWLIGFCLLAIYLYAFPPLERQLEQLNPLSLFLLSQAIPMLLIIWQYSIPAMRICSVAMGVGIGLFIIHSYRLFLTPPKTFKEFILRGLVGVIGTFGCYFLTLLLPITNSILYLLPRFLILGLWVSLGSHLVCRKLFANNKFLKAS